MLSKDTASGIVSFSVFKLGPNLRGEERSACYSVQTGPRTRANRCAVQQSSTKPIRLRPLYQGLVHIASITFDSHSALSAAHIRV